MATDLFLEHLIGATKEALSDGQSIDSMKRITQNSDFLLHLREIMKENLKIEVSSSHSSPDSRNAIQEAAEELAKGPRFIPPTTWIDPYLVACKAELPELKHDVQLDEFPQREVLAAEEGL
jgi:hypothetical protein